MHRAHWLAALVFAAFAAVQLNDPDPVQWVVAYGLAAALAVAAALGRSVRVPASAAGIAYAICGLLLFPGWERPLIEVEEGREAMGLGICALWSGLCLLQQAFKPAGRRMDARAKHLFLRLMNFWPPFLGAGIKVRHVAADFRRIDVEMRLRPWTKNYVGTHYGGSLYSMTDPFYMLMLIELLGPGFIVWDKAATIRFRKPGRGLVRAEFSVSEERLSEVRSALASADKVEPKFNVAVVDASGVVVAEVEKTLYIRRKAPERS